MSEEKDNQTENSPIYIPVPIPIPIPTTKSKYKDRVINFKQHPRRSKTQIGADILLAIRNGSSGRTNIMYKSNISWNILMEQLDRLTKLELVYVERKLVSRKGYFKGVQIDKLLKTKIDISYHLTPRGMKALILFTNFNNITADRPIDLNTHIDEPESGQTTDS